MKKCGVPEEMVVLQDLELKQKISKEKMNEFLEANGKIEGIPYAEYNCVKEVGKHEEVPIYALMNDQSLQVFECSDASPSELDTLLRV